MATGLKVSADSKGNLFFELETENGLTQIEGENIFKEFINKYPKCGVNWNMRAKLDVFTQELINKSETVFIFELRSDSVGAYLMKTIYLSGQNLQPPLKIR